MPLLTKTLTLAIALTSTIFYPVHAGIPEPEIRLTEAPFKKVDQEWVATIPLPPAAARFSVVIRILQNSLSRPLLLKITDKNGIPLMSAASSVVRGQELITAEAGSIHLTPRFVLASSTEEVLVHVLGDGASAPVEILSTVVDVGAPTHTQGLVQDGSRSVCEAKHDEKILARSVARLAIPNTSGGISYCTGFSIGSNYVLTNHHCVTQITDETCKKIQIEFNYICGAQKLNIVQPECVRIIPPKTQGLDYAVIEYKLAGDNTIPPLEPARIGTEKGTPFLLHHSAGTAMRIGTTTSPLGVIDSSSSKRREISIARAACKASVYSVDEQFFEPTQSEIDMVVTHSVNTTGGASGAPVIVGNKVVALHFDRDRRYYPKRGCFDASLENCMTGRLHLPNWAVDVCEVLADIPASIEGIRRCRP